jgi:hypothetical protein
MDTGYFAGEMIDELEDIGHPEGRNPHKRKAIFRFDNAPINYRRTAMGQLEQSGFKKMEQPPYGPDLAPCDFFLLVT